MRGLLGNADGNPLNDFHRRNGAPLPNARTLAQIRVVADAWRIDQAESLFDYEPGQSTATFTDLAYPVELSVSVEFQQRTCTRLIRLKIGGAVPVSGQGRRSGEPAGDAAKQPISSKVVG